MKNIKQFIKSNFHIARTRDRYRDELLEIRCPLCGDNKKRGHKNRVRAAFICNNETIFYNCFNCNKSLSVSERLGDLAYLLSREKEISYESAKRLLLPLTKHFISTHDAVKPETNEVLHAVECPGERLDVDGIRWLKERGFGIQAMLQFKQIDHHLYLPFTQEGVCFGYQEIDIRRKSYINVDGDNDLSSHLFGLDDIKSFTVKVMIVESAIDAMLITQDSESLVVGLALLGTALGEQRQKILESLQVPLVLSPDNDESGRSLINKVKQKHPEWYGSLPPTPSKDYGEYRKAVGALVALSKLAGSPKQLHSPALQLMGL